MRVLILGGTLFIGRRIALELLARGDDVMVVHRGQTEPAELSGCAHVHAARDAGAADRILAGAFWPVPAAGPAAGTGRALRQTRRGARVPDPRCMRAAAVDDLRRARRAAP